MTMTCVACQGCGVLDDVGQDLVDDAVDGELEPRVRPAASPSVCGVAARSHRNRASRSTRPDCDEYGCHSGIPPSSRMTESAPYVSTGDSRSPVERAELPIEVPRGNGMAEYADASGGRADGALRERADHVSDAIDEGTAPDPSPYRSWNRQVWLNGAAGVARGERSHLSFQANGPLRTTPGAGSP